MPQQIARTQNSGCKQKICPMRSKVKGRKISAAIATVVFAATNPV